LCYEDVGIVGGKSAANIIAEVDGDELSYSGAGHFASKEEIRNEVRWGKQPACNVANSA
jgi:hypothetical protein